MLGTVFSCLTIFTNVYSCLFTYVYACLLVFTYVYTRDIAGENQPTGAKFPIEIIDL